MNVHFRSVHKHEASIAQFANNDNNVYGDISKPYGAERFSCPVCNQGFAQKEVMDKHFKNKHPTEWEVENHQKKLRKENQQSMQQRQMQQQPKIDAASLDALTNAYAQNSWIL